MFNCQKRKRMDAFVDLNFAGRSRQYNLNKSNYTVNSDVDSIRSPILKENFYFLNYEINVDSIKKKFVLVFMLTTHLILFLCVIFGDDLPPANVRKAHT